MRRREFIIGASGAAIWPYAARAQSPHMRRVGVVLLFSEDDPEGQRRVKAFEQGMADHGWKNGRNVQIVYRFAAGSYARMGQMAIELAAQPVDVIVNNALTPVVTALKNYPAIPVVFAMTPDPVVYRVLHSLARPDRNLTGLTSFEMPSIYGKWIEFLKTIAPHIERVGILYDPASYYTYMPRPVGSYWLNALEQFAPSFGIGAVAMPVHNVGEIDVALAKFGHQPSGLVIAIETFVVSQYKYVVDLALRYRIPGCYPYNYAATAGGLMSYGPNGVASFRQVASYVDRILKGAKPSDLPIQRPNTFDLVINLKTAKVLGLKVPRELLIQATQLIE
jgi:ABC-type uncharacterized transport system substrate-binding protein